MIGVTPHQKRKILLVDGGIAETRTTNGTASRLLVSALESLNFAVISAVSFTDGTAAFKSDASICCIFLDWTGEGNNETSHQQAQALLALIRRHNPSVPVLLMAERECLDSLQLETMRLANEFVWMLEDTPEFIASRAHTLIEQYYSRLLPPFTRALFNYTDNRPEYSWAAPGHQGGVGFMRSAVGREFLNYFGENLFRTDTGIERAALGSLLDHTGAIGDSETFAARVFGAHRSYSVLNGTSGSNRTIMQAVVGEREMVLCDRNCHKSIEQGLIMTGAIPAFFTPTRNRFGIIGPVPARQFTQSAIRQKLENHPLRQDAVSNKPVYAVVTNCTYDGMCYNAQALQAELEKSVDQIHFDEAWYAYARFNPLYNGRYAMRGHPDDFDKNGATVFATHSTHKLLASLSQASWIHVRNGRKPVEHSRFNESYMLQATTSPLYAIIAANEMGAAMMDGEQGHRLTQEVIDEAVDFRLALAKMHDAFSRQGEWFFFPWNAPEITDKSGRKIQFSQASREQLATDPDCWVLKAGESWHGFEDLEEEWCMLDPVKAGIVVPGMGDDGNLLEEGIPAAVVSAWLDGRGIVPSRTTDFMILCLFSVGVTKGKWGTLLNVLLEFKAAYDGNMPLHDALPSLLKAWPERYRDMGLKDLCTEMFSYMKKSRMDRWQAAAFNSLPRQVKRPRKAFQLQMAGDVELLPLEKLVNRVSAVGVIPYPPGIPIVMAGECFGGLDDPWLNYISSIAEWGLRFPGFEKELEGAEIKDGKFHIWVLKNS